MGGVGSSSVRDPGCSPRIGGEGEGGGDNVFTVFGRATLPPARPRFAIDRASLALFMSVRSKVFTRALPYFILHPSCLRMWCADRG